MRKQSTYKYILLILIFNTIATISTILVTSTTCATEIEYTPDPKYGNSQSVDFANAVYGTTPPLTQEEAIQIKPKLKINNNNKFFVRIGAHVGNSYVQKVTNKSIDPLLKEAKVASTSQKSNSKHCAELAWGYKFDRLYLELEIMFTENTRYDKNPLFSNEQGAIHSVVKSQSILFNAYYDFINIGKLAFFMGAGLGNGISRTNSLFINHTISDNQYFAKRKTTGAYNLFLGGKINLVPQLFIGGYLRYTNFSGIKGINFLPKSKMLWQDNLQKLTLEGEHAFWGVGVTLIHLFL